SDRANGLSSRHPWRTVSRVLRARLRPGDRVLFRGGDTFSGVSLAPRVSGRPGDPIVFGSYGHGLATIGAADGAVYLTGGVANLVFRHLTLTTGDSSESAIVKDAPSGPASVGISVAHCRLVDSGGAAVLSNQAGATGWSIVDSRIDHVGDSGIIVNGARPLIAGNVITGVGWNAALPWNKHGVYVKAAAATLRGNRIEGFPSDGISLRYPDARVVGNTIAGGPIGIAYFSYSATPGTSLVEGNVVSGVSQAAFYYDGGAAAGGYPRESFLIRRNDFDSAGVAIDVRGASHASIRLDGNKLGGPYSFAFEAVSPVAGSFVERGDRILGQPRVLWNGSTMTFAQFRSGQRHP